MKRLVFEPEHEQLRETARQFLEKECAPHVEKWESERLVDRESYVAAGKYGLIGFNMPEEYGGGGVDDFRFNAVIVEEFSKFGPATPGAEPAERHRRARTSHRWPTTSRRSGGCRATSPASSSARSR